MTAQNIALAILAAGRTIRRDRHRHQQLQAGRQFVAAMFADRELNARLAAAQGRDEDDGDAEPWARDADWWRL